MPLNDVQIPVFDGEDYNMWKKRINLYLKMKKCDCVIERERASTETEAEWNNKEILAMNIIYSGITNKQLEYVHEADTAKGILQKFDEMYLKESTALQIICRNKLEKMRLEKFNDSSVFFDEFEKTINDLKSAGASISEKEKLNYMLNTLPNQYSYIGDLIDTLKENDQTAAYVKNKIQIAEMKNKNEEESCTGASAFAAKKFNGNCYNCGKSGHMARHCQNGTQGSSNQGTSNWNSAKGTSRGQSNNRSNRGNNRGRGNFRQRRGQERNMNEQSSHTAAWMAVASVAKIREISNIRNKIEWLLDSGCTDHIVNSANTFMKVIRHI
ncbi:hypothetical protein TKK_0015699 [Trichogramma kaykai]|uniref:CCHC-type domain-containing protein n=1 Tax=Trichogramma kaykai TaxID=54128 RepID=A0ABD2W7P3_9HYME